MREDEVEVLFQELIKGQRAKMLAFAQEIRANVTHDDLLQPQDYPELEVHPYFRYEEGVLEGILTAQMALKSRGSTL
jgi:hypothetical protein